MSSLADELLDDLDGLSGGEEEPAEEEKSFKLPGLPASTILKRKHSEENDEDENMSDGDNDDDDNAGGLVLEGGVKPSEELDQSAVDEMELGAVTDVRSVAKLEGSKRMTEILKVNTLSSFYFKIVRSLILIGCNRTPSSLIGNRALLATASKHKRRFYVRQRSR